MVELWPPLTEFERGVLDAIRLLSLADPPATIERVRFWLRKPLSSVSKARAKLHRHGLIDFRDYNDPMALTEAGRAALIPSSHEGE